eukprot:m.113617 g.113617  ORF g.113617 m.113617 type:complete len:615 (-) comp13028_c0_seq1:17-1861(-)
MFGYAYRQLVAEGEGLKRRREVQRVAMNKAAKSSTNLVTFDSPTGVLRKGISPEPNRPIPPNSVYFVEDESNSTWKHTVRKVKGTDNVEELVELVDVGEDQMSCTWFMLMLFLCLLPYAIAVFAITFYFMLDDPFSQLIESTIGPIDSEWWLWWAQSSDETLADPPSWLNVIEVPDNSRIDWGMIVRSGTPVVLRSAASSWQIVQNSNRSGFLETILQRVILSDVHTMRVKPSAHALFVNHDHQARTKKLLGSLGHPEHTEIPHMPFAEFMSDCLGTLTTREGKSLRCYWAGSLPETLLSYVPTHTQDFQPTSELKATRAWISTGGVSAQTHYDTYHNCLIQLAGSKRVTLVPPDKHLKMKLFPSLHPGYRQSQRRDRPKAGVAGAEAATLRAGDALYIPPMWFHRTDTPLKSTNLSVSMNIWTLDLVLRKAEDIFEAPIPFEENWSDAVKGSMLARYTLLYTIPQVLALQNASVIGNDESRVSASVKFVENWLESRFRPLLKNSPKGQSTHPLLPKEMPETFASSGYCGDVDSMFRPKLQRSFQAGSKRFANMFKLLSAPAREIFLQDWLEEAIAFVVGERYVVPFARMCLLSAPGKSPKVNKVFHAPWLTPT